MPEVRQEFTAAEYTVADAFVGPCLDRVTDTLATVGDFSWSVESRFCNPSLAQIMPAQAGVAREDLRAQGTDALRPWWNALPYPRIKRWWLQWPDAFASGKTSEELLDGESR